MKKVYSLIIISAVVAAACSRPAEEGTEGAKSVEQVIAEKDIEAIKAKKAEVLSKYEEISADLASLETALSAMDTSKRLPIVTSFKVKNTTFKHYVDIQGDVATRQNLIIYPEFQGSLKEVYVTEGERVSKGQLLAKIDDGGLSKQLAQMEVQKELAKTTFERQKRLWDQKIGSEIQYLQAKTSYEAGLSGIAQMKSQLEKTNVRAPFSGVIDDVITDQGQIVGPQSQLIRIVNLDKMYVKAEVPESYISKIKKGTEVTVEALALGKSQEANVRQVGSFINPANRTFSIEIPVSNKDKDLKPNLIVNLKINDYSNENALLIPNDIIQENARGEKYIYLLKGLKGGEASLKRAQIKTGYNYNNMVEVLEGLNAGDIIVKEGAKSMREGLTVKVKS